MNKIYTTILIVLTFVLVQTSMGEDLTSVDEIVSNSNRVAYYQGQDGRAKVSMVITDSQGRIREKEMTILRLDGAPEGVENATGDEYCGDQKFYVFFSRPADENKTVFMVWKHIKSDDDRWMYLPALDLVKRIASTEKRTSFVGSDFFYEDVSGRNLDEDNHELLETTKSYYVLKNTPKNPDSVEFSYYKMWVHKSTFLTTKVEYYDKSGELYRQYDALKVDTIQGFPTITQAGMKDLRTKSETVNTYSNVEYNIGLPDDIFTERYLRRAPMKYLR